VEARRRDGTLTDVDVRVGRPDPAAAAVLGLVDGQEAVDYLLDAARRASSRDGRDLILAAALAGDAVRWPGLLDLARNRDLPERTRKAALQWLGREAAAEAARELGGIVRDRTEADEIRETAVFAISQLPDEQAVDMLIEVVRTVPDARVRSRALFWLADFDHPRAIALFEEILTRG
jgi:HEAT repeat protein